MNSREVFSVGLKLQSLNLLYSSLLSLSSILSIFILKNSSSTPGLLDIFSGAPTPIFSLIRVVVYLFLAYLLWFHHQSLTNKLIPQNNNPVVTKDHMLLLVVAYYGFSLIVYSALHLLFQIPQLLIICESFFSCITRIPQVVPVITLLLGIFFLLKAPQVAQFISSKILSRFWK